MSQNRNKLTTTRRNSGSFVYPNANGIGVTVGIASTAYTTDQTDIVFRGIHHLKSPVEALVHLQAQGGASGPGGGHNQGGGGSGGGGGYVKAKLDSVIGKRFIATVGAPAPAVAGFWFCADNYVSFANKGGAGGGGSGDTDPGRCTNSPGGGAGSGGPGTATTHPNISMFSILYGTGGSNGTGGGGFHQCDHSGAGSGAASGGKSGFGNFQADHPFAVAGIGSGAAGGPNPAPRTTTQPGFVIVETPGRPWNMKGGGYPTAGYTLS
jgi:hypothetical protein